MKIILFCLAIITFLIFGVERLSAASSTAISATVNLSVCGNLIKEQGEDCDNTDLGEKSCNDLGFTGGTLACDIGCGFDVSSCSVPSVDSTNVSPDDVGFLAAAGYFDISSSASYISTPTLTATTDITINVPVSSHASAILIPQDVVISRSDGEDIDPLAMTTSSINESTVSGITGATVEGAIQWGLTVATLEFSDPITISLFVGTDLNGEKLGVLRSDNISSGWTNEGIVPPATCTVQSGFCTFQTTKASYFTVTKEIPTSTPTPTPTTSSSSSDSTSTSSTSDSDGSDTSSLTPNRLIEIFHLPQSLLIFDVRGIGQILRMDLADVTAIWVESWKSGITNNRVLKSAACDINRDGNCGIEDFSILMYYVGR